MPFESELQRKAMYAAASGHGNIGIPKQVAEKFIKHSEDGDIPEEAPSIPSIAGMPGTEEKVAHVVKDAAGRIIAVFARWSDAQQCSADHRLHGYTVEDEIGLMEHIREFVDRPRLNDHHAS